MEEIENYSEDTLFGNEVLSIPQIDPGQIAAKNNKVSSNVPLEVTDSA